jgi:hypothetical protein
MPSGLAGRVRLASRTGRPRSRPRYWGSRSSRNWSKLRDVIGLYLAPADNAVVVSMDEKSQIEALDRTPMLPLRPGLAARRTQ